MTWEYLIFASGFLSFHDAWGNLLTDIQFVFLGPEICLQLPPHPASRRRSCCSARGSRSPGSPEDLHLQVTSRLAFATGSLLTGSACYRRACRYAPCPAHIEVGRRPTILGSA